MPPTAEELQDEFEPYNKLVLVNAALARRVKKLAEATETTIVSHMNKAVTAYLVKYYEEL